MDARAEALRIQRLRDFRSRPAPELGIGRDVAALGRSLARSARSLGTLAEAWEAVCPSELARRTALAGLARGVLTVHASDPSTRFELDRFLRSGGERALVASCRADLRRVKVVVGATERTNR